MSQLIHPILDALDGTSYEWLKKLMFTFNEGSIGKFEALAPLLPHEPILQENYSFLRQKICLMALIESVFRRGAYDRTMSFKTIAEETHLPVDEVEHLLMKALRCVSYIILTPTVPDYRSSQPEAHPRQIG